MKFRPQVTHAYWRAVQGQDWTAVRRIIGDIEMPWFDLIRGCPAGSTQASMGRWTLRHLRPLATDAVSHAQGCRDGTVEGILSGGGWL